MVKNPDKMSINEMRSEIKTWRMIGLGMLDSLTDWSTGHTDRNHFVTENEEKVIKELVT